MPAIVHQLKKKLLEQASFSPQKMDRKSAPHISRKAALPQYQKQCNSIGPRQCLNQWQLDSMAVPLFIPKLLGRLLLLHSKSIMQKTNKTQHILQKTRLVRKELLNKQSLLWHDNFFICTYLVLPKYLTISAYANFWVKFSHGADTIRPSEDVNMKLYLTQLCYSQI